MRKIIGLILSGICMIAIVMITTMSGYLANPEHKLFRLLVEPINLASLAGLGFFIYLFWWFSYGVVLYLVTLLTLKIIFLTFLGLRIIYIKIQRNNDAGCKESYFPYLPSLYGKYGRVIKTQVFRCIYVGFIISLVLFVGLYVEFIPTVFYPYYTIIDLTYQKFFEPYAIHLGYIGIFILKYLNIFIWSLVAFSIFRFSMSGCRTKCDSANSPESKE